MMNIPSEDALEQNQKRSTAIDSKQQSTLEQQQLSEQQQLTAEYSPKIFEESIDMDAIARLQAEKGLRVRAADIQKVSERAQWRAFAQIMLEETLALVYKVDEEFETPGLKEQLKEFEAAYNQAWKMGGADFLSQAPRVKARGSNGSTSSSHSDREQSLTAKCVVATV